MLKRLCGYSCYLISSEENKNIVWYTILSIKGIEHVPHIFMSFDKYLFLEVINIPI